MFAILWSRLANESFHKLNFTPSENSIDTAHPDSGVYEGRFGGKIYTQIRRFVVLWVNRHQHFVEAW